MENYLKPKTNLSFVLLHITSDDQLLIFSFYVPIWFPSIHHYLCQCQITLN